ncbi:hypothetical protein ACJ72_08732 [Emergomyces africanus]|uniref:Uncharacterized protein n=1 Tax=Emergomyces africanus TaxID=1955775 RepID=A0A1B7NJM2_9EURO|nr:hypothetical protein ACJ72_08732 [Emergomyces africanus]
MTVEQIFVTSTIHNKNLLNNRSQTYQSKDK